MGMLGRGGIFMRQNLLAGIGSLILTSEENDRLLMGSKMGRYKRVSLTPPHLSPFPFHISLYCNGFHHEETQLGGPSRSRCGAVRMTASRTVVTKPLFCISCSDSAILIPAESGRIQKGCGSVATESGGEFSTCKISLTLVPSHEHGSHENWQVCIPSP